MVWIDEFFENAHNGRKKRYFVNGQMKINIVLSMNNFHLPTPSFNFYCGGLKRKKLSFFGSILLSRLNEESTIISNGMKQLDIDQTRENNCWD